MTGFLAALHFLRPWWLLTLPLAILLYYLNVKNRRENDPVSSTFAPHLLPYLTVADTKKNRFTPNTVLLVFWLIAGVSLAGPSWRREPSPFTEDQALLVIVQKNTPSMLSGDIQPSRLERSVHKISDLLELRKGAKTALIVYAGSSHLVMPLTRDGSVITTFAGELTPKIMPKKGDNVAGALIMAADILSKENSGGSILLITDSLAMEQHSLLQEAAEKISRYPVIILAMAAPPGTPLPADSPDAPSLDLSTIKAGARLIGASVVTVSPDSADIVVINNNIVRDHTLHPGGTDNERWRDGGYILLPLLLLLAVFWCRRGWYVRWEGRG